MTTKKEARARNPRDLRIKRGENQETFWGRIRLSQSAGSRYESGRQEMQPHIDMLYGIVYRGERPPRLT